MSKWEAIGLTIVVSLIFIGVTSCNIVLVICGK